MRILIIGGGICGLGAALLLARDGHEVTVLERDAGPIPQSADAAWEQWERKGVAQFRQPHNFMPGLRLLLEAELPDIQDALGRAGANRFDLVNPLPPFFTDRAPRPIDEKLWTLTARRPVGEWVFANAAQNARGVTIRRGVGVETLLIGPTATDGIPHVAGVRTSDGDELRSDLVVDATGRQSRSPQWLAAIGARPPYEEQEDCGFTYYTRYFRGVQPQRRGARSHRRFDIAADAAGRSRHVVGHHLRGHGRPAAEEPAARGAVDEGHSRVSAPRALARGRADHSGSCDERHRRSLPPLRRRRHAGRDRLCRRRRCMGVHESIGGPRFDRRVSARAQATRRACARTATIQVRSSKTSIGEPKRTLPRGTTRRLPSTAHALPTWWRSAKDASRHRPPMNSRGALAASSRRWAPTPICSAMRSSTSGR